MKNHEVELGTLVGRPEIGFSASELIQNVLYDETLPTRAELRVAEELVAVGDSEKRMKETAVSQEDSC